MLPHSRPPVLRSTATALPQSSAFPHSRARYTPLPVPSSMHVCARAPPPSPPPSLQGMGEPLNNYEAVCSAVHMMTDPRVFGLRRKKASRVVAWGRGRGG